MTKKDEAFGLFAQGKLLSDPEVVALGLAKASVKKYYQLWKQLSQKIEAPVARVSPVAVCSEVELAGVPDGRLFEYRGQTYKRGHAVYSGQVIVLPMHKAHYTTVFSPTGESVYLPPGIMVTPK